MMAVDFAALYEANFMSVRRYIYRRVSDNALADDLTQDVFVKALSAFAHGNGPKGDTLAWLYRIAHNAVVDHHRPQRPVFNHLDALGDFASDHCPHAVFEQREIQRVVHEALQSITVAQREVVLMRMDGYSHAEIASQMGGSEITIRTRFQRALHALHARLSDVVADKRPTSETALTAIITALQKYGPMTYGELIKTTRRTRGSVRMAIWGQPDLFVAVAERPSVRGLPEKVWGLRS